MEPTDVVTILPREYLEAALIFVSAALCWVGANYLLAYRKGVDDRFNSVESSISDLAHGGDTTRKRLDRLESRMAAQFGVEFDPVD